MSKASENRIAKNTMFLYFRMLIVMAVSLYTARVILDVLGASDYGIYNVVGGIVAMMGFLNGALSASTSRFLTYEMGKGNKKKISDTFSASLNLHIIVGILIIIVGETLGMWFLYDKMIIPADRMNAAFWVFQFSIITAVINIIQIPYSAAIIAHENMFIYAFVGLYEAVAKLLIAYAITVSPIDKLIFYALLLMVNTALIQFFYRYYSYKRYTECRFRLVKDKILYKSLLTYSGWDLFGNIAIICQTQGINILLNLFFGPVVNAARAIAVQMQTALNLFVNNFLIAVRPQVVKKYAEGDYTGMYSLTFYASKFSYMLMLALILPFCFEMDFVLKIWLGDNVPEYTKVFAIIILVTSLFQTWSSARLMAYHAIGRIKTGNIIGGSLMIFSLPLSYAALKQGYPPQSVFWIILIINFIVQINGMYLIYRYVHFDFLRVVRLFFLPCITVSLLGLICPLLMVNSIAPGIIRFILLTVCTESILLIIIIYVGLSRSERDKLFIIAKQKLNYGKT